MAHHAAGPAGVGGAGAHDTGDLFGHGPRTGAACAGVIKVVHRGLLRTQMRHRGGKTTFVAGIVRGEQDIAFGQVLHMGKAIGAVQLRLQRGAVLMRLALGVDCPL